MNFRTLLDTQTIVLPTARAIRYEQLHLPNSSLFLPNYVTMSDFLSKLCVVDGYRFIDEDTRTLLLLEASDFDGFSSLQIERNFFTFTKNSSYIFKFFGELSAELYDISSLISADVYAEYEEHITILGELYKRYEKLCHDAKYLDRIFLPKLYSFNESYLKCNPNIVLKIDGHLTNFEFELLERACEYSSVTLLFSTSRFNLKMQERLRVLGIETTIGKNYTIDFNTKKVIEFEDIVENKNISCESFSEPLLQVAFVKNKIYEFVKKGYKPENIAVIVPNESFAQLLKNFDTKSNLNLAMGEPFRECKLYRQLQASIQLLDLDSVENRARQERVGDQLYIKLLGVYYKEASEVDFIEFMRGIEEHFSVKREVAIYKEELFNFERLLPFMESMRVKSLLNLFMQRLAARSLDDIRGGKITVMGVLETRSVAFDGVIIVDFDDKNVPKRSDKDMFLNSAIREVAGLPTMSDRENLQKHYYTQLLNASKEVAISFVSSSESEGSRFLKQLGVSIYQKYSEFELTQLLFKSHSQERKVFQERTYAHSFRDIKLSATRLKTYLTCKRKYYFKYVEFLKNHTIPSDMPEEYEIGNAVHLALKELYSKKSSYLDSEELQKDLERELEKQRGKSELEAYLIEIQKRRLQGFATKEVAHFEEGYEVIATEEFFEVAYKGIVLIGQIDRVDRRGDRVTVLDYKTGNYTLYNKNNFTEATDFQLEFYYLLAAGLGTVESCAFYDLKELKIVPESFLAEKLELLDSHIKDLLLVEELDTQMCEDEKNCTFCEYKIICGR